LLRLQGVAGWYGGRASLRLHLLPRLFVPSKYLRHEQKASLYPVHLFAMGPLAEQKSRARRPRSTRRDAKYERRIAVRVGAAEWG